MANERDDLGSAAVLVRTPSTAWPRAFVGGGGFVGGGERSSDPGVGGEEGWGVRCCWLCGVCFLFLSRVLHVEYITNIHQLRVCTCLPCIRRCFSLFFIVLLSFHVWSCVPRVSHLSLLFPAFLPFLSLLGERVVGCWVGSSRRGVVSRASVRVWSVWRRRFAARSLWGSRGRGRRVGLVRVRAGVRFGSSAAAHGLSGARPGPRHVRDRLRHLARRCLHGRL